MVLKALIKTVVTSIAMSVLFGCGGGGGTPSTPAAPVVPAPVATAPVANAGTVQSVIAGSTVTLDGSGSSAANGATITYSWSFSSKPGGSSATLSSATVVKPTFTADVAGAYVLSLVVNDGTVNSAAATVTVTASVGNAAPVANAGSAQSVVAGTTVTLDGSASSDANGDTLTYKWSFTSGPSSVVLSNATAVKPTFMAGNAGDYVFSLVVNDGKVNSADATVTVTASVGNAAPVANAGVPQSVIFGTAVALDGSASSDANVGDTLTYNWSFTSGPSSVVLSNATAVKPTFMASNAGVYVFSLIVNDGKVDSAPATVTVTANDNILPVTTASPGSKKFTDSFTVTLTSSKPATIYYTTNGVDPNTVSPHGANTVNIPISITTILKFFAISGANQEGVKTETYTATGSISVTW
jgi:chitinase